MNGLSTGKGCGSATVRQRDSSPTDSKDVVHSDISRGNNATEKPDAYSAFVAISPAYKSSTCMQPCTKRGAVISVDSSQPFDAIFLIVC